MSVRELIKKAKRENTNSLNLLNKGLTTIPDEVFEIKSLTSLYLSSNQLKEIPAAIEKFAKLKYLLLTGNKIKEIPINVATIFLRTSTNR